MLSNQEKMQIREVVDQVIEARLLEFSEVQLTIIKDMMLSMTDHYVEALMKLVGVLGLPEARARQEAERMAEMMAQGLRGR